MSKKNSRILFIKPWPSSSFITNDEEILKKHYDVNIIDRTFEKHMILKVLKILLKKDVDLIFIWFAAHYFAPIVFLSRLFRIPSVIIVGGYDVANLPEINYGQFASSWHVKQRARFVLKYANKILVVDPSLKEDAIKNAKIKGKNIDYLPTVYDANFWKPKGKKENIVLTVAMVSDMKKVKLKGLDVFIKSAKHVKETKFIIIGIKDQAKKQIEMILPSNVELIEFLPKKKLLKYYQIAKVYCQLSLREGLPNALCEAMLCECIPIGTKYCGIPTAIGDTGFYVSFRDHIETAEAIRKALKNINLGKKARDRIKTNFPLTLREVKLVKLINSMIKEGD